MASAWRHYYVFSWLYPKWNGICLSVYVTIAPCVFTEIEQSTLSHPSPSGKCHLFENDIEAAHILWNLGCWPFLSWLRPSQTMRLYAKVQPCLLAFLFFMKNQSRASVTGTDELKSSHIHLSSLVSKQFLNFRGNLLFQVLRTVSKMPNLHVIQNPDLLGEPMKQFSFKRRFIPSPLFLQNSALCQDLSSLFAIYWSASIQSGQHTLRVSVLEIPLAVYWESSNFFKHFNEVTMVERCSPRMERTLDPRQSTFSKQAQLPEHTMPRK